MIDDINELYKTAITLTDDKKVELRHELSQFMDTSFQLCQSSHTCRYGALGDGHEKLTPAQRYYQAIKECYSSATSIRAQRSNVMLAQADLLEGEEELKLADTEPKILRAEAKVLSAKERIFHSLVMIKDVSRVLDTYNKVRLELKDEVESKYPLGIEQAEMDNWEAVFKYRMLKSQSPGMAKESVVNIPLPAERKAELGAQWQRLDAMAPLFATNAEKVEELMTKYSPPKQLAGVK